MFTYLWSYFLQMLPHLLCALLAAVCMCAAGALIFLIVRRFRPKFGASLLRSFYIAFPLTCYYLSVIAITAFFMREPGARTLQLIPFHGLVQAIRHGTAADWGQIIMNIVIFFPAGILPPFLSRTFRNRYRILLPGAMLSLLIELSQLIAQRGYCDIDDFLFNLLGTAIGALLYTACSAIRKKRKNV